MFLFFFFHATIVISQMLVQNNVKLKLKLKYHWIIQFEGFHRLSHHELWAIIPYSANIASVRAIFLGCFYFYFRLVFHILWAFLIKQLFHSRLLDIRWLKPTRRCALRWLSTISYPKRAGEIIVQKYTIYNLKWV